MTNRFHHKSPSSPLLPSKSISASFGHDHDHDHDTIMEVELNNETIQERQNYSNAQYIKVDKSITTIAGRTFYRCKNLETISIPPTVSKIGIWSFYASSSLRSIILPHSVTSIGKGAFRDCTALSYVHIPNSVRSIGDVCFSNCRALRHVVVPDSVSCIGVSTFSYCESLLVVHLPRSVVDLEKRVFWGCRNLLLIYLPKTVIYVKETTFDDDCELLERRATKTTRTRKIGIETRVTNSSIRKADEGTSRHNQYLNYHFDIITWLRQRFDNLPIHRTCYDYTTTLTVDVLSSLIKHHALTLHATDALGMTALHILSCNPNVNEDMIRLMRSALSSSSLTPSSSSSKNKNGSSVDTDIDSENSGRNVDNGNHDSDDGNYYRPESPLKLFLMCRNYLDIPPSSLSSPSYHQSTATLTLLDLLQRGIKCDELACAFALDNKNYDDDDDDDDDDDCGNEIGDEDENNQYCGHGNQSNGSTSSIDLDLLKPNECTALLPFMSAATLDVPNCGLDMVYMLAMKDPNVLQQQ